MVALISGSSSLLSCLIMFLLIVSQEIKKSFPNSMKECVKFESDSNFQLSTDFLSLIVNCVIVLQSEELSPASKQSRKGRRKSAYQVPNMQLNSQSSVVIRLLVHVFSSLFIATDARRTERGSLSERWFGGKCRDSPGGQGWLCLGRPSPLLLACEGWSGLEMGCFQR